MKKYSKREKLIIRLMIFAVLVAVLMEGWDAYVAMKQERQGDIDGLRMELKTYTSQLKNAEFTVIDYEEKTVAIDEQILRSRDRIMQLPSESAASLLVRQHISDIGQHVDTNINSITTRPPEVVNEESGLLEMKTYFTYDSELEGLLNFFQIMDQQGYYMVIDQLNLRARPAPRRRRKGRTTVNRPKRNSLSGNMILSTLYLPNEDGKADNYGLVLTGEKRPPRPRDEEDDLEMDAADETIDNSDGAELDAPEDDGDDRAMNVRHNNAKQLMGKDDAADSGDEVRGPAKPTEKPELQKRPRRLTGTKRGL